MFTSIFILLFSPAFADGPSSPSSCGPGRVKALIDRVERILTSMSKERKGAFDDILEVAQKLKMNPDLSAENIYRELHLAQKDLATSDFPIEDPLLESSFQKIKDPDQKIIFQKKMMGHADTMAWKFGLQFDGENHFIANFQGEGPRGGFKDSTGKISLEYRQYSDGASWFVGNFKRGVPSEGHFTVYLGVPPDKMAQELPEIINEAKKSAFSFKICGTNCYRKDRLIFYFSSEQEAKNFAHLMDQKLKAKGFAPSSPRFSHKIGKGHVGMGSVKPGEVSHHSKISNILLEAVKKCKTKDEVCIRAIFNSHGIDPETYGDMTPSN